MDLATSDMRDLQLNLAREQSTENAESSDECHLIEGKLLRIEHVAVDR
jgi:hypothetical protein